MMVESVTGSSFVGGVRSAYRKSAKYLDVKINRSRRPRRRMTSGVLPRRFAISLCVMGELRLVELSAATIVAVNNLSLKPGQEQFLAPVSYGIAATVVNRIRTGLVEGGRGT